MVANFLDRLSIQEGYRPPWSCKTEQGFRDVQFKWLQFTGATMPASVTTLPTITEVKADFPEACLPKPADRQLP